MNKDEKDFIKNVNIDKAKNKVKFAIIFIGISIITYIIPFALGYHDFGIVFECVSLGFILISRYNMSKYDEIRSKLFIFCAMSPIIFLLVYDFANLSSGISSINDIFKFIYVYLDYEKYLICYIIVLLRINKDLSKANNPIKYKESTDWFYETKEK